MTFGTSFREGLVKIFPPLVKKKKKRNKYGRECLLRFNEKIRYRKFNVLSKRKVEKCEYSDIIINSINIL